MIQFLNLLKKKNNNSLKVSLKYDRFNRKLDCLFSQLFMIFSKVAVSLSILKLQENPKAIFNDVVYKYI